MKGKKHSEATKQLMSSQRKGKKRDPEHIKKWVETRKAKNGYVVSEEQREKISKKLTGTKQSEETKQKRAEVLKLIYKEHPELKEKTVHLKENHWNWQGGKSFEEYPEEFYEIREYIRQLHGNVCALCEKTPEENEEELSVHHIDYDKTNNEENNLIPLCRECHLTTNYHRKEWIEIFRSIKENMGSQG